MLVSTVESLVAEGILYPYSPPPNPKAAYHEDYVLRYDQTLRGIFSTVNLYPKVEEYWVLGYATLSVTYVCSPLVLEYPSSLTFSMNGTPFYSVALTGSTTGEQRVEVAVPVHLMREGTNTLEILGYARLWDEEGCIDDYSNANWVNILADTTLRVGYDLKDDVRRLSYFPFPFLSSQNENGQHTLVAVSASAAEDEISAAMTLMASLGNQVGTVNELTVATLQEAEAFENVIYFGLLANTPQRYIDLLPPGEDLSQRAVAARTADGELELLLVVSESGEALLDAARMLADESRVSQEKVDVTYVDEGVSEVIIANRQRSAAAVVGEYTLGDVAGGGLSFVGPFHQEKIVYLPVGTDYMLSAEGKFTLNFRYSENLDFTRSLLTVYWGSIPVGSKKLTREGAAGDSLVIYMPADAVGTNASSLTFTFDLEIEDLWCTPRQEEMPWAYLTADSLLYLPVGNTNGLDLANRPVPFVKNGVLTQMLLVVSDQPKADELTLLGRALSVYGANTAPYGQLATVRAGSFDPQNADFNIFAAGMPANTFFHQVSSNMYFYYDDTGKLATNTSLYLSEGNATSAATIQLLTSPFSAGRAMLLLTSPVPEGLQNLSRILGTEEHRWNLKGDCVLVDQDLVMRSYRMATPAEEEEQKPTFAENLSKNKDALIFTLVATGALILLLLAVILVLLRIRMRSKPEKK